jgi:hypothetical protein
MISVQIYRSTTLILDAKPNENSNVKQEIMGEHILTLQFDLDIMYDLRIGDYCIVYGNTYFIHAQKLPVVTKKSQFLYEYDLQMVAPQYLLQNIQYLFLGDDNSLSNPDFSLYGTADNFMDLLIKNAARTGFNWKKGGVILTEYKNLTFSAVDCLSALGQIAEAFDTEWFVDGTTINLAKKLNTTPYSFQYGKGRGAYDIKRMPADSSSVVTRLYVFGSTKNIPAIYRNGSTRLLLPASSDPKLVSDVTYTVTDNHNGQQVIMFYFTRPTDPSITSVTVNMRNTTSADPRFTTYYTADDSNSSLQIVFYGIYEVYFESFTGPSTAYVSLGKTPTIIVTQVSNPYALLPGTPMAYIEHNTELYGVIEQTLIFDDIYPHRTGIVTGVDATDPYSFVDSTIDFDVNLQLLPGTSAKVVFNTGQLSGYTFEIKSGGYNNAQKKVTLLPNKEEKAIDIPSNLLRPAIGDEYVFVDIVMPQTYIEAAESALLVKAQDYLNTYSAPVYSYAIDCDPIYFRLNKVNLAYGDVVRITDVELGIDRMIRILSVVKQLTDEYNYSITLGEAVSQSLITQINNSLVSNSNGISNINGALNNSPLFEGTLRGEIKLPDIEQGNVGGMRPLYIDNNGKVWKG